MNQRRPFADLLKDLRIGDERAAAEIVQEYTDALVAVARRQIGGKLGRRIDPEDIVQSTYRSLFVRMKQGEYDLGNGRDLWKLLVTITLNKVRSKAKYHTTGRRDMNLDQSVAAGQAPHTDTPHRDGPTPADAAALVDELQAVLTNVNLRDRSIIELRFQGHSTSEIADETGRSQRSVRRILQHFEESLRKSLER